MKHEFQPIKTGRISLSRIPTLFLLLLINLTLMSTENAQAQELKTVPHVDLEKYAGKWYEIASFPQRFQKGCQYTTATYTPTDKGYVLVENRCRKHGKDGKKTYVKAKAFVVKNSGNAKLKVQFFWPFKGKYWIIDLADDYTYAVVSHPNRQYLWILSRKPDMDKFAYEKILAGLKEKRFDLSKLSKTVQ